MPTFAVFERPTADWSLVAAAGLPEAVAEDEVELVLLVGVDDVLVDDVLVDAEVDVVAGPVVELVGEVEGVVGVVDGTGVDVGGGGGGEVAAAEGAEDEAAGAAAAAAQTAST